MKIAYALVGLGVSLTSVATSRAQTSEALPPPTYATPTYFAPEQPPPERGGKYVPAPKDALELSLGTGYTQGFGSLRGGVGMPSVAKEGLGLDLGIGYRIDPHLAVMAVGQYQEFNAERTASARGFAGTLGVQYHMMPTNRVDPWVDAGFGYRLLWEVPTTGPTLLTHGLDVGRVRLGVDFRSSEAVSVGPMIGADATVFLFQDFPNVQTNISDPRLSMFVYAGLQGRFDIGGGTTGRATRGVAAR
jgi:hypothetical protein